MIENYPWRVTEYQFTHSHDIHQRHTSLVHKLYMYTFNVNPSEWILIKVKRVFLAQSAVEN